MGWISESLPAALCYFLDSDLGKGLRPLPPLGVSGGGVAVSEVAWELISNADLRPPGAPCAC